MRPPDLETRSDVIYINRQSRHEQLFAKKIKTLRQPIIINSRLRDARTGTEGERLVRPLFALGIGKTV